MWQDMPGCYIDVKLVVHQQATTCTRRVTAKHRRCARGKYGVLNGSVEKGPVRATEQWAELAWTTNFAISILVLRVSYN